MVRFIPQIFIAILFLASTTEAKEKVFIRFPSAVSELVEAEPGKNINFLSDIQEAITNLPEEAGTTDPFLLLDHMAKKREEHYFEEITTSLSGKDKNQK